jgi:UDP-N-acetylmuramoyl-tripeptide--D-alanyl-D-alanine ligase
MKGKRLLVIGDMAELGERADAMHAEVGKQARTAGIQELFALGEHSRAAAEAFGSGAQHFENYEDLIDVLQNKLDKETVVLVKGSRAMQMERVALALIEPAEVH